MFERKGVFEIEKTDELTEDDLMMAVLDAGAEDVKTYEDSFEVLCAPEAFNDVMDAASKSSVYYHTSAFAPRVDVKEEENSYTLEMELPGRSEEDVNIELDHDNLTIASKNEEKKEKKEDKKSSKYILKERRVYDFTRRFTLPVDVDSDSITANFKNGILTINMKKKAVAAPKKILIEAC